MEEVGGVMAGDFRFEDFDIAGVRLIEGLDSCDERGRSAKNFSRTVFAENGIDFYPLEMLTISSKRNVIRGLHFQRKYGQSKLISCITGSIFVVAVDVDYDSDTFGKWCSAILDRPSKAFFAPKGCAVGTMALEDTIFTCACGENVFMPEYDAGICWDDSDIGILWPRVENLCYNLSDKDKKLMSFKKMKEKELIKKYEKK